MDNSPTDPMAKARAARVPRRPPGPITEDTPLKPREQRFVREYVVDQNGAESARKAGYPVRSARVQASELLTRPNIQRAVEAANEEWLRRAEISTSRVARDISTAANLDVSEFLDKDGNILPLKQMPPHVRRCIVSIEVVKRNLTAGDGQVDEVLKIRLIDKARMHEILAKATGLIQGEGQEATPVPTYILPSDTPGVSVH